jgi:hypothetical protein
MLPIQSMVKRSQEAKMNSAIAIIAMQIAKSKNDQDAKRAAIGRNLLLTARANVLMKYGGIARQKYMQNLSKN